MTIDNDGLPHGEPKPTVDQVLAMKLHAQQELQMPVDDLNMAAIVCVCRCDSAQACKMPRPYIGDCAQHGCLREHVQRQRWVAKGLMLPPVLKPGAPRPQVPREDA